MQKKLTELQAFNAMSKLFRIYYKQTLSDDLGTILGGMSFITDKKTADIAMLEIWRECLDRFFLGKHVRNYNYLTILQAFIVIGKFLEEYFGLIDVDTIVHVLQIQSQLAEQHKHIDLKVWQRWLTCVDEVLLVKDSRYYLQLLSKKADYTPKNRP